VVHDRGIGEGRGLGSVGGLIILDKLQLLVERSSQLKRMIFIVIVGCESADSNG
jgi:hypothetical protein